MIISIICVGTAVTRHRDFILSLAVGNRQCSVMGCDLIVVSQCAYVQRVGELILAAANQRLGSGDIIGRAFAGRESIAGYGDFIIGQRVAVILLLGSS